MIPEKMTEFEPPAKGDRVRIDVPHETDPNHRLHVTHGRVVKWLKENKERVEAMIDAGKMTPTGMDSVEAVRWYERVLGLEVSEEFRQWAEAGGPLLLETDGGETKLAVFEGHTDRSNVGSVEPHLAFRADADSFVTFVDRLEDRSEDTNWPTGSRAAIVDHDLSFSIYFRDPSGNRLEVTTDEYEEVADELRRHSDG